jgi:AcrR family transcriptional regulator
LPAKTSATAGAQHSMPKKTKRGAAAKHFEVLTEARPPQAEKLASVALELFARCGFSAITIKDIAKAANVNSALLYYYFEDKEDLFRASIERAILLALDNYARLKERHTDPVDLINDWFENNVEMAGALRKLVKIMLDYADSSLRLASIDRMIREFYAEEAKIIATSIRRGIEHGLFQPVDADRLASFASVHLDGIMIASTIRPDLDLDGAIVDLRELVWHRLGYVAQPARRRRAKRVGGA